VQNRAQNNFARPAQMHCPVNNRMEPRHCNGCNRVGHLQCNCPLTPRAPNATISNQFVGNIELCSHTVIIGDLEEEIEMEGIKEVYNNIVPIKKEPVDDEYLIILSEKINKVWEEVPVARRYFEDRDIKDNYYQVPVRAKSEEVAKVVDGQADRCNGPEDNKGKKKSDNEDEEK
jgi:hypothetical protein